MMMMMMIMTKVCITILQLNDVYVHVLALNMLTRVHKLG